MKKESFFKIVCLATALFLLSSCSSMKDKTSDASLADSSAQQGAQTSALSDDGRYQDTNNPNRMKAPYDQTYYFVFDKFDVSDADAASAKVQGDYLLEHKNARIRLEGNADERGSREYNVALGWRRAQAVADLLKQQGVPDAQVAVISFGKEKPAALGHDEDSYKMNRRVNLVYERK